MRVRGGPGDRRVEQRPGVLGQVAHEVLEAAAVLEVVDPLLATGGVLTGTLRTMLAYRRTCRLTLMPALTSAMRDDVDMGMRNG